MGLCDVLFKMAMVSLAASLAFGGLKLANSWLPENCDQEPCLKPLFAEDERVDVYMYTSRKSMDRYTGQDVDVFGTIQKGTTAPTKLVKGFTKLQLLFNRTNISTTEFFNETVVVKLPQGVRNNGTLYAHTVIVRAGMNPNPKKHLAFQDWRPEDWRRTAFRAHPYRDLIWHSAPVTRYMVPVRVNTTNLLADILSNSTKLPPGSVRMRLPEQITGMLVPLHPLFNSSLTLHPMETAAWSGLVFIVTAFYKPTAMLALVRLALVGIMPYLYTLYQKNVAFTEAEEVRARTTLEGLLKTSPKDPVTHWRPKLTLRLTTDTNTYPAWQEAPKLFDKYYFDDNPNPLAGMTQRAARYDVYGGDWHQVGTEQRYKKGELYYVPRLYVENNIRQYHWGVLSTNESMPDPSLRIEFSPLSKMHYSVLMMIQETMKLYMHMGATEGDIDELRYMMVVKTAK